MAAALSPAPGRRPRLPSADESERANPAEEICECLVNNSESFMGKSATWPRFSEVKSHFSGKQRRLISRMSANPGRWGQGRGRADGKAGAVSVRAVRTPVRIFSVFAEPRRTWYCLTWRRRSLFLCSGPGLPKSRWLHGKYPNCFHSYYIQRLLSTVILFASINETCYLRDPLTGQLFLLIFGTSPELRPLIPQTWQFLRKSRGNPRKLRYFDTSDVIIQNFLIPINCVCYYFPRVILP